MKTSLPWLFALVLSATACKQEASPSRDRGLATGTNSLPAKIEIKTPPPAAPAIFSAQLFAAEVPTKTLPASIGIETLGGVNTVLIPKGTPLPTRRSETFSTGADNQPSVQITAFVGERPLAAQNWKIGELTMSEIPPAPRGLPQISVEFFVDAQGRLEVRARDMATAAARPISSHTPPRPPMSAAEVAIFARAAGPAPELTQGGAAAATRLFGDDVNGDLLPLSLGIETLRQENTIIIAKGTPLPTLYREVFSTALDNQASVEVHVIQGERTLAGDNRTLAKFQLGGIPPAPRGVPQIELSLGIDQEGVMTVHAKDLGTKREQAVTIVGGSKTGLSAEDIERMLDDARTHRAEDQGIRNQLASLNQLDALAHSSRSMLMDPGIKLGPVTRSRLQTALKAADAIVSQDPRAPHVKGLAAAYAELQAAAHAASRELYERAG